MRVHLQVAKKTIKVITQFIIFFGLVLGGLYGVTSFCQWRVENNQIKYEERGY